MTELITKFQGLVSQRFLLGYFLPFSLFYLGHSFLYLEVFTEGGVEGSLTEPTFLSATLLFIALLAVSYVVSPLNVLGRRFLEGNQIPKRYRDALLANEIERHTELEKKINEQRRRQEFTNGLFDQLVAELETGTTGEESNDTSLVDDAINAIEKCAADLFHKNRIYLEEEDIRFSELKARLSLTLGAIYAHKKAHRSKPDVLVQLDKLEKRIRKQFDNFDEVYTKKAETAYTALFVKKDERYPRFSLQPTSLGNMKAALYSYALTRYGVGFDFLWRQITTLKSGDDKFSGKFLDKESQIEFLVNQFFLSGTFLIWPVLIFLVSDKIWLFLLMAITPPVMAWIYYFVLEHAYYNSMIAKRSAIDLYRFDVLESLHLRLPRSLEAERQLWVKIQQHAGFGEAQVSFRYEHDAS